MVVTFLLNHILRVFDSLLSERFLNYKIHKSPNNLAAEELLQFDVLSDTGGDIDINISKGLRSKDN